MTEGQAKVNLILELKERLKTQFQRAKETVNHNVSDIKAKLASLKQSSGKAMSSLSELPGIGGAMGMIANPYALVAAGLVAVGAAGFKAAEWSMEWEKNMAKVNVTAQLTPQTLDKLSEKLVEIGTRTVAPLEEVPVAFNRIISAGLDVNTSLKVLEPTLRAAKAGFTDVETVAAAGVGVMAASGEDINKVYDILFATLNKGNAEFKDIAHYLPKIVPLARAAGFALDETAGAWAYLTAQGQSSEQATTGIQNMMKALSSPDRTLGTMNKKTGVREGGLASLGVKVFDDSGKMKPLIKIIQDLSVSMAGLTDKQRMLKFSSVGLDTEAATAFLSMIQNVGKLKEITDFTANSAGQLGIAYNNSMTSMDNWKIVMNKIKGDVIKPIGDVLMKAFAMAGVYVLNMINYFKDLYNNSQMLRDVISGIGTVIKIAMAIALFPIRMIINGFKLIGSVIGWVWEKFAAITGISSSFEDFYLKIRPYFIWLKDIAGQIATILYKVFTLDFKGAWSDVKNFKMPNIDTIRKEQVEEIKNRKKPKEEENPFAADPTKTPTIPTPENNKAIGEDSINGVTGSAKQIRNITVNIDSFVKGMSISNQNAQKMDEKQLESYFTDLMMRVVRNLEVAY